MWKLLNAVTALVLTIMFILAASNTEHSQTTNQPPGDDFAKYANMDRQALLQAMNSLSGDRIDFENHINEQLRAKIPEQERLAIIYEAGLYRLERTVPTLASMIDYTDPNVPAEDSRIPLWSYFPVTNALISIGNPSVSYMISNIIASDKVIVRYQSATVLRIVLGVDGAECTLKKSDGRSERSGRDRKA